MAEGAPVQFACKGKRLPDPDKIHVLTYNCTKFEEEIKNGALKTAVEDGGFEFCFFQDICVSGDEASQQDQLEEHAKELGMELLSFFPSTVSKKDNSPRSGMAAFGKLMGVEVYSPEPQCIYYPTENAYLEYCIVTINQFAIYNINLRRYEENDEIPAMNSARMGTLHSEPWTNADLAAEFIWAEIARCRGRKGVPIFVGNISTSPADLLTCNRSLHSSLDVDKFKYEKDGQPQADLLITSDEYKQYICCHKPMLLQNQQSHGYVPFDILLNDETRKIWRRRMCQSIKCVFCA